LHFEASDWIALASGAISFIALGIAIYAVRKGNRNSSAATLVTLNDGFRQAWLRFLNAKDEQTMQAEFSELMNLIEIACAIYLEKSLSGVSRELAREYLEGILNLIKSNADARSRIEAMRHSPTTFKYIRKFRRKLGSTSL